MRSWGGALFSLHSAPKLPETPLLTVQVAAFGAVLQTLLGVAIWYLPKGAGLRSHAQENALATLLFLLLDSLQRHGLQHARLLCPSLSPQVCANSCPLSW